MAIEFLAEFLPRVHSRATDARVRGIGKRAKDALNAPTLTMTPSKRSDIEVVHLGLWFRENKGRAMGTSTGVSQVAVIIYVNSLLLKCHRKFSPGMTTGHQSVSFKKVMTDLIRDLQTYNKVHFYASK